MVVLDDAAKPGMLTDIGKFTALALFLCLLVAGLPMLSFLTLALCPLPILFIAARRGVKAGFASISILGVILVLLIGTIKTIPLLAIVAFFGLVYLYEVKGSTSFAHALVAGTAIVTISLVLSGYLIYQTRKTNIVTEQVKELKKDLANLRKEYVKQGISEKQIEAQFQAIDESLGILPKIIPAIVLIFSAWIAFLNLILSGIVLKKLNKLVLARPVFKHWQFPWYFAWGYIIGLAGTFFSSYLGVYQESGRIVGMNFLVVFNLLFLVQGFAIIYFYFEKLKIKSYIRALVVGILIVIPLASPLIAWLGLLDVWFNFRKMPSES